MSQPVVSKLWTQHNANDVCPTSPFHSQQKTTVSFRKAKISPPQTFMKQHSSRTQLHTKTSTNKQKQKKNRKTLLQHTSLHVQRRRGHPKPGRGKRGRHAENVVRSRRAVGRGLRPDGGGSADSGAEPCDDVLRLDLGQRLDGGGVGEGREAGVAHVVVQSVVSDQAGVVVLRPCKNDSDRASKQVCRL